MRLSPQRVRRSQAPVMSHEQDCPSSRDAQLIDAVRLANVATREQRVNAQQASGRSRVAKPNQSLQVLIRPYTRRSRYATNAS